MFVTLIKEACSTRVCCYVGLPTAAHFLEYFLVESVAASDCFDGRSLGSQVIAATPTVSKYVTYFLEISLQGTCSNSSSNSSSSGGGGGGSSSWCFGTICQMT